ncbi:MAG TPA: hypothetical protein PK079_18665 [Leptospiraceae bacterium]|nr:hypothetical protein [Leptospiraceae bacterium]HMW08514.1 hypothetical protein [Leptospiraceae bacterium]HMX31961.1 hypothetical protein [Leptospiraceae bacterium]HMY34346.1 hypothetical protein [Leptospiraceae bacterium]HMZ66464.1 hypothetical protein [Leptospiraceae bacterium]
MKSFILLFLFIFSFFYSCKKTDSRLDQIHQIQSNQTLTEEESLYQMARIIFSDTLKNFKLEKNSRGANDVSIEFGGNRAYTFYSESDYKEKIQFDVVRYILLYSQVTENKNIGAIRISLVKPYFVKEPDAKKEITEEFEVFRVNISMEDIKKISGWNNPKIWNDSRNINSSNMTELFNQVRLKWKIELNELSRIELK